MSSLKGQKNGRSDTSCVKSIHVNTSKGTVPAHPILQTWWDHNRSYPVADSLRNSQLEAFQPHTTLPHCGLESPAGAMGTAASCELRHVGDALFFPPTACRTELSPRCLSVSLDSGAYLGNAVIVFGSSSNANMFGVAFTCATSWIWCSLLASWAPAHVWDTHINKKAS